MRIIKALLLGLVLFSSSCTNQEKKNEKNDPEKAIKKQKIISSWNYLQKQYLKKSDLLRTIVNNNSQSPGKAIISGPLIEKINSVPIVDFGHFDDTGKLKMEINALIKYQKEINSYHLSSLEYNENNSPLLAQLESIENNIRWAIGDFNQHVETYNSNYPNEKKNIYIETGLESNPSPTVKFE